ncbi:MAG: hypothetical protein DBY39_07400 [Clostridiales bacterium]|nr:MAG: hypothetical protein DBY39_07400 [Clostridiales bacterium]
MPYAFSIKGKKAEDKRRAGKGGAKVRKQAATCPDEVRHKTTDNDKKRKTLPVPQKDTRGQTLPKRVRRKTKQENHGGARQRNAEGG